MKYGAGGVMMWWCEVAGGTVVLQSIRKLTFEEKWVFLMEETFNHKEKVSVLERQPPNLKRNGTTLQQTIMRSLIPKRLTQVRK